MPGGEWGSTLPPVALALDVLRRLTLDHPPGIGGKNWGSQAVVRHFQACFPENTTNHKLYRLQLLRLVIPLEQGIISTAQPPQPARN